MMDRIMEIYQSIPKPVIFAVVILALIAIFFLWKKFSSKDKESEVIKGVENSQVYARNIATALDQEAEPMMSAVTPEYAQEVQTGLGDLETTTTAAAPEGAEESDDDFEAFEE
ncbi:hypothetical protein PBCVAN69C_176L [Paramecium bursaria Chlorella virus AN69C]|uniref:Uncharacterized protein n=1 Tax=Paramecium bursaria Chlorella virus IL3A TaxID=46019 RepID=M1I5N0_PBCVI|nr:hypothetical protein PBCVAN69C_176L [Paramecium bursaria Chlorella virus AN69C]AGE53795.1 hypothetical protein PBCVIL3A_172L [Paramecium bursaria Chlorella virus IL3A]